MDNKHYTPDINEFHPGFQYESHGITDSTKDKWKTYIWDFNYTKDALEYILEHGGIRVKHLDREDIEGEGFEFRETNKMSYWYDFKNHVENREGGYKVYSCELLHNPERNIVEIRMNIEADEEKMFDGVIRNISELRIILRQLGIAK